MLLMRQIFRLSRVGGILRVDAIVVTLPSSLQFRAVVKLFKAFLKQVLKNFEAMPKHLLRHFEAFSSMLQHAEAIWSILKQLEQL